jgi:hypothetical protein
VIKRCVQGEEYIQLVASSLAGYWFVVKDEKEAGISKRMENFIKAERHKVERIKHYCKHFDEIRQCKHGHQMGIIHRLPDNEYFCHCLLCGCEGGHSKDIDEAVSLWNEEAGL